MNSMDHPAHTTRSGRPLRVIGQADVLTLDRLEEVAARFDREPRLASLGVIPSGESASRFAPATAPAGVTILLATDLDELIGPIEDLQDAQQVLQWARHARGRGFFHEWWLHPAHDLKQHPMHIPISAEDANERDVPSSALFAYGPVDRSTITITVDATWLGPHQTGAQVLTTEAVRALARRSDVSSLTLSGIDELPAYAADLAENEKVQIGASSSSTSDIYWFPNQWDRRNSAEGIAAHRIITTYLDFIAYGVDAYHGTAEEWLDYRSLQRRVALMSDGITTISADVADQLLANVPLMDPRRVRAIPLGVDHLSTAAPPTDQDRPAELSAKLRPFVLVLGNDFRHKNRDLAIKVWSEVLDRGVSCDLVLAGLHVRGSSSRQAEQELLASHVNLRGEVHVLGHVDEAARGWLLANAAAVLYPSSAEGFGFVPFEAASLGTPASFVSFGSLRELTAVPKMPRSWTVESLADDVVSLLTDPQAAKTRVRAIQEAGEALQWDNFADRLVDFARAILAMPTHLVEAPITSTNQLVAPRRSFATLARRLRRWNQ